MRGRRDQGAQGGILVEVSRDLFVQDLPQGIASVDEIPSDWRPTSLPFGQAEVLAVVLALAPEADLTDPAWVHVSLPGADIEVCFADGAPLTSFALHVRAADHAIADEWVRRLLNHLGARALDSDSATGLFEA